MKSESQGMKTGRTGLKLVMALALVGIAASTAAPAAAQQGGIELTGTFGYVFSEGVNIDRDILVGLNEIDFTDGMAYGGTINYWMTNEVQLGFQFGYHDSGLDAVGANTTEITSMAIYNYHGIFTYNWGTSNSQLRPFIVFGLGATQYSPDDLENVSFGSEVQFSGTLGAGVKTYLNERVGLSFSGRWTPTYIKSDADGMYCSPYWNPWYPGGCMVLQDTDYSNQMELTGGIILRF